MTAVDDFFVRPRLREGVQYSRINNGFLLSYRRQSAELDVPDHAIDQVADLLDQLRVGAGVADIAKCAPDLVDYAAFLHELDRLGLLTEVHLPPPTAISGKELYRLVRRFTAAMQTRIADSRLYLAMVDGSATRNQLIGYAIEYHHVVRQSPSLIAPSLAHAWRADAYETLQRFLADEIGHDSMTRCALRAAGVSPELVEQALPLPATFALCATLGATAAQDPLSFAACLSIVEEPSPRFNVAFAKRCSDVGLPPEFSQPLLEHSGVNEYAHHADISQLLLSSFDAITREHIQAVLKQVGSVIEAMLRMESSILQHYSPPELAVRIIPTSR